MKWKWHLAVLAFAAPLLAQEPSPVQQVALGGPRFLRSAARGAPSVDPRSVPMLQRRVTLSAEQGTLGAALQAITEQTGIHFLLSRDVVPVGMRTRINATGLSLAAALTELLLHTEVDVAVVSSKTLALVRRGEGLRLAAGSIVGRVTDTTGQAVARAEVYLEGTRWRTETDTTGRYRLIEVDSGNYTLAVRRLGYKKHSQEITVHDRGEDTVDFMLVPMPTRLQELVSTGTGRRRRVDVANDVTTINADSVMQAAPIRSVTDLLENRVPGLTVQRTSGAPGDPSRLRLRGATSVLQNNDPIVVVDGARVYAQQSAERSANLAGGGFAAPSPLDYIDPNSIETIEVLKGPSAATLYGQDAANGVIVITTKKGRAGPTGWTASLERGRTTIAGDYPELYYRVGHGLLGDLPVVDAPLNCDITNTYFAGFAIGLLPCIGDSVVRFQVLNDPNFTVLNSAHRTALSLGVSGGNDALTYAITGSYRNELGLITLPMYEAEHYRATYGQSVPDWIQRPQQFTQWQVTSNFGVRVGAKADISLTTMFARSDQRRSSMERQLNDLMTTYIDPVTGTYYQAISGGGTSYGTVSSLLENYYQRATDIATSFTNSTRVEWRPSDWLRVEARAGLNFTHRTDQLYFPRGPVNGLGDTTGSVTDAQGQTLVPTLDLQASGTKPIGAGFRVNLAVGANYAGRSSNDLSASTRDLESGASAPGSITESSSRNGESDATFGWYMEPSIGNPRFNVTLGLRLDGGKSYGGNVSGLRLPKFPKLGFTYLVSDEAWFPFKDWVQSLRVRVAYGRAGRQPGITDRLRLYTVGDPVFADGEIVNGVKFAKLGNTEVRPERTSEFEGGFEVDMLDSRLFVEVTGYRKTTDDALMNFPIAPSVNGENASIVKNIGVIRSTGLNWTLSGRLIQSPLFSWSTQVGFSHRRDVVVSLGDSVQAFYTNPSTIGGQRVAAGYPPFGRWARPIVSYADGDGDGVLQRYEYQLGDSAVFVGGVLPDYDAVVSTTVSFWNGALEIDASFAYQNGLTQRNETVAGFAAFSPGAQVPGTSLDEQAATANLRGNVLSQGFPTTDYNWIQTVNTTRLNSLSVRYTVPNAWARRLGAQRLSVAIQGANLGLWTNYRGMDPNVNAFSTGNNLADTGVLPQPRTWQIQVNAQY